MKMPMIELCACRMDVAGNRRTKASWRAVSRKFVRLLFFCLAVSFVSQPAGRVFAQDPELSREFLDGVEHYRKAEFSMAAEAFSRIANTGVENGKLYYNLANAYLKSGETGRAILWYERALRLSPRDPDLKFNLEYARSFVKDAKEEKASALERVVFFWRHALSPDTVKWIAIVANLVSWLLLALKKLRFVARRQIKALKAVRYAAFLIAIVFAATASHNFYRERNFRSGIILSDEVSVRSGLSDDSTELFVLHAGTKIKVERETQNHYRIYFSEDKIGWLKKSEAAPI